MINLSLAGLPKEKVLAILDIVYDSGYKTADQPETEEAKKTAGRGRGAKTSAAKKTASRGRGAKTSAAKITADDLRKVAKANVDKYGAGYQNLLVEKMEALGSPNITNLAEEHYQELMDFLDGEYSSENPY